MFVSRFTKGVPARATRASLLQLPVPDARGRGGGVPP